MSGNALNGILFLISCVFDFYIMVLFMRLVLAWVGADYNHPVTQFIVKLTSFLVVPLKKYIPDIRGFETSTLVLVIIVEFIKYFVLLSMSYGMPNILGLIIIAIADACRLLLATLSLALLIQVILGFVQTTSPVYPILCKFTAPLTRPLRFIPTIGGIDIAPVIVIVILQLLIITVINPFVAKGLGLATGA